MKYLMNKQDRTSLAAAKNDLVAARAVMEAISLRAGDKQVVASDDLKGGFLPYLLKEAGVEIMPVIIFSAESDAIRKESPRPTSPRPEQQRPVFRGSRAPGKTARKRASGALARAEENRRYNAASNSARAKSLGAGRKA